MLNLFMEIRWNTNSFQASLHQKARQPQTVVEVLTDALGCSDTKMNGTNGHVSDWTNKHQPDVGRANERSSR